MSSVSTPDRSAKPRSKRRWFDARLAIGIVLVAASVTGVVAIVTAADRTVTVYAAGEALVAGDLVAQDDLVATEVRLGALADDYLAPGAVPGDGVVVTRTIGSGELIPRSAVGRARSDDWSSVVVAISGELPRSVVQGALVDLWAASGGDDDLAPTAVATEVTVVDISDDDSLVAGSPLLSVELLVQRERIARVLKATASGDVLSLVPAAVPVED